MKCIGLPDGNRITVIGFSQTILWQKYILRTVKLKDTCNLEKLSFLLFFFRLESKLNKFKV